MRSWRGRHRLQGRQASSMITVGIVPCQHLRLVDVHVMVGVDLGEDLRQPRPHLTTMHAVSPRGEYRRNLHSNPFPNVAVDDTLQHRDTHQLHSACARRSAAVKGLIVSAPLFCAPCRGRPPHAPRALHAHAPARAHPHAPHAHAHAHHAHGCRSRQKSSQTTAHRLRPGLQLLLQTQARCQHTRVAWPARDGQ